MSCFYCKKETIMLFNCKCEYSFCLKHRLPESHRCTFDFYNHNKDKLKRENPVIQGSKLQKI